MKLADHTSDDVAKLEGITTQTKFRFFLGLCKVFRWFASNIALFATLFNNKLRESERKQVGGLDERSVLYWRH